MANKAGPKADKIWSDAVRIAAMRECLDDNGKKTKRISRIADNLVRMALDGDMAAIKEIGDRIDGKPAQAIVGDPDAPITFAKIAREIVDP